MARNRISALTLQSLRASQLVSLAVARIGLPAERMTDDALLAGLAAGGPDVGLAFVRRFQRHVYGVALAVVGDAGLAEDVAQQTFERAWKRAGSFDSSRGSVRTWLTTISHNLAIDCVRSRKPTPVDPTDLIRLLGSGTDEPENRAIRSEAATELRAAIGQLPQDQARALVMAGVYGMTAQEVADADGIPLGTAKTRIRSAMIKLRAALDHEGVKR
jgi:RNA polymerase sigma-70 factor (ECF subfamily)